MDEGVTLFVMDRNGRMEPIDPMEVVDALAQSIPEEEVERSMREALHRIDYERRDNREPKVPQALVNGCLWAIGVCTIIGAATMVRWVWYLARQQ